MKNWKIYLTSLFLTGLLCIGCDKYESTISGTITYLNADDHTIYPASEAVVSKMIKEKDSLVLVTSVRADTNGYFLFEHTTRKTWILQARLQLNDSVSYIGFSEEFSTNGMDKIEQNILLHLEEMKNEIQE